MDTEENRSNSFTMSESDDSDILADIQALDNALMLNKVEHKADSSWHNLHDDSSLSINDESSDSQSDSETYIDLCQNNESTSAYEVNKKLLKGLMIVKKKLSTLLHRCEEKIEELNDEIDMSKDGSTLVERTRYSIAGMPYFKDKSGFSASKNLDTKLKEARKELSVIHVQKPCRWSSKDRTTLSNAICDEVFKSVQMPGLNEEAEQPSNRGIGDQTEDLDETNNRERGKSSEATNSFSKGNVISINFGEMVRAMKNFDWMRIAAQEFENKHTASECEAMWNVYLHPDIKKSDWTKREDSELLRCAKECNYQDWNTIAVKLGTMRSGYQCFIRFNTIDNVPFKGRSWSKAEDEHLLLLISKFQIGNYIPWSEVASYLNNRTKQQVYTRWMYRKAPHLRKGRFTVLETQTLLKAVKQYGEDFSKIARYVMPHRTSVQLNGHYQTVLQEKGNTWEVEDDVKLIQLHKKHGNEWVEIAKNFNLKTRTQVRQRYMALQRYMNKGYSIANIPRSNQPTSHNTISKSTGKSSSSSNNSKPKVTRVPSIISNNDIRARLFENLSFPFVMADTSSQELCDVKQLEHNTKELYDTLKLLDTNDSDVSNNLFNYAHVNKKERQLFTSLKRYVDARYRVNSDERDKIIEMFRCRMFGPGTKVTSHFIPPLPSGGYVNKRTPKRASNQKEINYNINHEEKFLVDMPTDIVASNINSSFLSVEEEIQFQKFTQLLTNNNYSCNRQNVNSRESLRYKSSLDERKIQSPLKSKPNIETKVESSETIQSCHTRETTRTECVNGSNETNTMNDAIAPSHQTLLGLKNLLYWKLLYEYESTKYAASDKEQQSSKPKSPEYEKAYQTLKTRLMRLFKFPLALSRVMLNLPDQEMLFLMDKEEEDLSK